MAAASRLGRQIEEVIAALEKARVPAALIGGLALAPHSVVRATQDVDLLTDARSADALDRELTSLGYRCVHRSADAANYVRGDERLDLLYASRPVVRQLIAAAQPRTQDLEDIRVPTQPMRDPFEALDDRVVVVEALCPTWPWRESFGTMPDVRL